MPTGQYKRKPLSEQTKNKIGNAVRKYNSFEDILLRKSIDKNGCWNWTGMISKYGYGKVYLNGKNKTAHRVIFERLRSKVPEGLALDHLCRNRACVNPDHLEIVTHTENNRRGSSTKLSKEKVIEIHRLNKAGVPRKEIAKRFGVKLVCVRMVLNGQSWKEFVDKEYLKMMNTCRGCGVGKPKHRKPQSRFCSDECHNKYAVDRNRVRRRRIRESRKEERVSK